MSGQKSESEEEGFKDPFSALYEIGNLIFADDAKDIEKGAFHTLEEIEKGESPVHHWIVGLSIMVASAIGKVWFAVESARQVSQAVQKV